MSDDFRDFTDDLVGRMQAKRKDDKLRSEKALHDASLLKKGFNDLGEQAIQSMGSLCNSINNNLGVGVRLICTQSGQGIEVGRVDVPEKLQVNCYADKGTIEFVVVQSGTTTYRQIYHPKLDKTDTSYYFVDSAGSSITVNQMCMKAMDAYLGV